MSKNNDNKNSRWVRISYEKQVKGDLIKREIILTGYHGMVLITLTLLVSSIILLLSGVKFF